MNHVETEIKVMIGTIEISNAQGPLVFHFCRVSPMLHPIGKWILKAEDNIDNSLDHFLMQLHFHVIFLSLFAMFSHNLSLTPIFFRRVSRLKSISTTARTIKNIPFHFSSCLGYPSRRIRIFRSKTCHTASFPRRRIHAVGSASRSAIPSSTFRPSRNCSKVPSYRSIATSFSPPSLTSSWAWAKRRGARRAKRCSTCWRPTRRR